PTPHLASLDPTGGFAPRPAGKAGWVPTPHLASLDPTGGFAPRPAGRAGWVPTPHLASLERPEVAEHGGPAELVVERGAAERPVGHDLQRRRDPARRADPALGRRLPGLERAGQPEIRDREADEASLGLGAAPGRALVADLAARAGRRPRERRDRRRVVVGLDLAEDVRRLAVAAVHAIG